jgi:hypothetical protein
MATMAFVELVPGNESLSSAEALCFVLVLFEDCRRDSRGLGSLPSPRLSRLQTSNKTKTKHKPSAEESGNECKRSIAVRGIAIHL